MNRTDPAKNLGAPPAKQPFQPQPQQVICNFCKKPGQIQRECRRANGWCLVCGAKDHQARDCPIGRMNNAPLALPAPPERRNPGPVGRGVPLPPQRQVYNQAHQRPGAAAGRGRGRGQAFNLTAEDAEVAGDVVADNILVHSVAVLALFDSGASHCFISDKFVRLHSLPQRTMNSAWEISTGNGVIVTNKICKSCPVVISGRTLEADMFVIDT